MSAAKGSDTFHVSSMAELEMMGSKNRSLVLNDRNVLASCHQNIGVEVFGVFGPLINLTKLFVTQKPDHLIQTQAWARKRWAPQLFKHFPSPVLRGNDKQRVV